MLGGFEDHRQENVESVCGEHVEGHWIVQGTPAKHPGPAQHHLERLAGRKSIPALQQHHMKICLWLFFIQKYDTTKISLLFCVSTGGKNT